MSRILAIVKKDIVQIFRNRFISVITFLVIFVYAAVYVLLPSKVDETFKLGIYIQSGRDVIEQSISHEKGVEVEWTNSIDELRKIVAAKDVSVGFAFTTVNNKPGVQFFFSSDTPDEIKDAGRVIVKELAYNILGYKLPVETEETIIGPDMLGQQIPPRDKLRILFLIMVLLVELFGIANILMEEIQKKTISALFVTPLNLKEYITAKALTGVSLAFFEGLIVSMLLGALTWSTLPVLIIFLFLGSILVTGIAFIIGSISRNFVSLVMTGVLPLLILILPCILLIYPAAYSPLINAIPTYQLIVPLDGVLNYHFSMVGYFPQLMYLLLFDITFFIIAYVFLRRRIA